MTRLLVTLLTFTTLLAPAADLLRDDFTTSQHPTRKPTRGPWKIQNGTATCTQDDALYAKFKKHGPVIWYDVKFTDATLTFQFKPDPATKTFVFTLNGTEGHVFRFVTSARGTGIRAFPPGPQDHASIALGKTGPALNPGAWTQVKITLTGPQATVQIGDTYTDQHKAKQLRSSPQATVQIGDTYTETVTHPSLARPKTTLSLGFSYGTLAVKDLAIEAAK